MFLEEILSLFVSFYFFVSGISPTAEQHKKVNWLEMYNREGENFLNKEYLTSITTNMNEADSYFDH